MDVTAHAVEAVALERVGVRSARWNRDVEGRLARFVVIDVDVVQRIVAVPEFRGLPGADQHQLRPEGLPHLIHHRLLVLGWKLSCRLRLEYDDDGSAAG